MADAVKPTRRYESPRRREQAETTRAAILEAARELFTSQGYAATTMAAIARGAGVSLKTVYVVFETKSGVLLALWHLLLRGDDAEVSVGEQPWYHEVLTEPDPERQLRLNARNSRMVKQRAAALMRVIRDAAASDADLAALWARIQSDFHANQREIVASLHERGALVPGLDVERGADVLWALNHPDLWHLLVGQRGWSPDDYERWFGDTACAQLLATPPHGRPALAVGGRD